MATVFIFEYITGGGMLSAGDAFLPGGSLLREGTAMAVALAEDFLAAGFQARLLRDGRLPVAPFSNLPGCRICVVNSIAQEQQAFQEEAAAADWTVLIAPETDGALLERTLSATTAGARLLSPSPEFVAVASDKSQTAACLSRHGIPVPTGICLAAGKSLPMDFAYPAVRKPVDGAGSCGVQWIADAREAASIPPALTPTRLEKFCPGIPASVAVICGHQESVPLPACRQRLGRTGSGVVFGPRATSEEALCPKTTPDPFSCKSAIRPSFEYQGGETPLAPPLACRAERLAVAALSALPKAAGYVGIDLVLGDATDGSEDVVIEVNPRLTTSYIGLRAACRDNLAAAMVDAAKGERMCCRFDSRRVVFSADGTCQ